MEITWGSCSEFTKIQGKFLEIELEGKKSTLKHIKKVNTSTCTGVGVDRLKNRELTLVKVAYEVIQWAFAERQTSWRLRFEFFVSFPQKEGWPLLSIYYSDIKLKFKLYKRVWQNVVWCYICIRTVATDFCNGDWWRSINQRIGSCSTCL